MKTTHGEKKYALAKNWHCFDGTISQWKQLEERVLSDTSFNYAGTNLGIIKSMELLIFYHIQYNYLENFYLSLVLFFFSAEDCQILFWLYSASCHTIQAWPENGSVKQAGQ